MPPASYAELRAMTTLSRVEASYAVATPPPELVPTLPLMVTSLTDAAAQPR
jgi:hypothetical protein